MLQVVGCIAGQHDLRLVALAAVLCLFASITAMTMIWRASMAFGRTRLAWIMAAGIVAGSGIWGTHFVAMLAYQNPFAVAYDPGFTILSALIAMTMCGAGFAIAICADRPIPGGAVTGAAIAAMHYVGMAAVRAPADAIWDGKTVATSVLVGVVLAALGMALAHRRRTFVSYTLGAALFALAICAMHFIGMSAVRFRFSPTIDVSGAVVDPGLLAVAVAALSILVVALGLIGALLDRHLAQIRRGENERLREHIAELEKTKSTLEHTSLKLSSALAVAAAADRAKSAFLATVSHELRTPLNAIIGFSEMLTLELFGPLGHRRYRDYAVDIHHSGVHLLEVINDILDLSRIDAGDTRLDEENVDLRKLIGQSLKMIRPQALAAGVELVAEVEATLPVMRADPRRLKQALINLLGNAVKFTPAKGRITVAARETTLAVELSVADTGIGIAGEDISRALERFGQVDSRLSRKYEGVGLGLPLARQFVELHGGMLTLHSTVNIGTTVRITLPTSRILARPRFESVAAS
jgi:signal transduction histidine kinase